jgi:hypothetical protein
VKLERARTLLVMSKGFVLAALTDFLIRALLWIELSRSHGERGL